MPRSRPEHVPAAHHNAVLDAAYTRATTELEDRLTEILEPILARAGETAAKEFRSKATDHLTAAAHRRADRAAILRSGIAPGDLASLIPLLAAGALDGVTSTSTMICVKPRPEEAQAIADPGGSPADGLHVTLAYLGKDLPDDRVPELRDVLQAVAAEHAPLVGRVGGYGEFRPPGCGILLPDVPGLVELRVAVTETLVDADIDYGRDHGFQAHITVDGAPEDGEIDAMLEQAAGAPLHFDALLVVRGDATVYEIPLVGVPPITASMTAAGEGEGAGPVDTRDVAFRVAQFEQAIKDFRKALQENDPAMIEAARQDLDDARDKLQEMLAGSLPTWTPPAGDEVVNAQSLADTIRAKTEPVRQALIETTMTPALAAAGLSFDVTNPLTQKALASTGAKVTGISESTRADVMQVIKSAWEDGLSIDHTSQLLSVVMKADAKTRARMIARTELVGAVNGGSLAATKLVGEATGSSYLKAWMIASGARYPRHETYDGLDGQTVGLDEDFDVGGVPLDHPGDPDGEPGEVINCFPPETLVQVPALRAAMCRRYEGDLVRVRTAAGDVLAGTPNHPVLRADGVWVPLREVEEGDDLVRALLVGEDERAPDPHRPTTAISEVYRLASSAAGAERVRFAPPDLHGDGADGEIDVVPIDGSLLIDVEAASDEQVEEFGLALAAGARTARRYPVGTFRGSQRLRYLEWATTSSVRVFGEESALVRVQALHPEAVRVGAGADGESHLSESSHDSGTADAEVGRDPQDAVATVVSLTKVIEVERETYHGYVYNLDTGSGWYTAESLVCRNCRCTMRYVEADEDASGGDAAEAAEAA